MRLQVLTLSFFTFKVFFRSKLMTPHGNCLHIALWSHLGLLLNSGQKLQFHDQAPFTQCHSIFVNNKIRFCSINQKMCIWQIIAVFS